MPNILEHTSSTPQLPKPGSSPSSGLFDIPSPPFIPTLRTTSSVFPGILKKTASTLVLATAGIAACAFALKKAFLSRVLSDSYFSDCKTQTQRLARLRETSFLFEKDIPHPRTRELRVFPIKRYASELSDWVSTFSTSAVIHFSDPNRFQRILSTFIPWYAPKPNPQLYIENSRTIDATGLFPLPKTLEHQTPQELFQFLAQKFNAFSTKQGISFCVVDASKQQDEKLQTWVRTILKPKATTLGASEIVRSSKKTPRGRDILFLIPKNSCQNQRFF